MARAKEDIKAKARARTAKAEEKGPRACLRARDHAKVSKVDSLRTRALQSGITGTDPRLILRSVHEYSRRHLLLLSSEGALQVPVP